jgi:carboxypeptidase A4
LLLAISVWSRSLTMVRQTLPCISFLMAAVSSSALRQQRKTSDCFSKYDGWSLLVLSPCDTQSFDEMRHVIEESECKEVGDKTFAVPPGPGCAEEHVACPANMTSALTEQFGDLVTIESLDAGASMRESSGGEPSDFNPSSRSSFYSSFRNLGAHSNQVNNAVSNSGGACKLVTIGRSFEGRTIKAVRIRGGNWRRGGPRVVLTFGIHAREWVAHAAGTYAVEKMCQRAKSSSYFRDVEVVIVPEGNPDGYDYSTTKDSFWRKNRNTNGGDRCKGVDLNRNWPLGYGGRYGASTSKCSEAYIGRRSASEPESQAIKSIIDEAPVSVLIDTHCYGRYILKPWSYTWSKHPRIGEVDQLGYQMLNSVKKHRNNRFQYGGNELLGAASGVLQDYANGGLGYTYELTTAFKPSASEILPSSIECLDGIYAAVDWAKAKR